MATTSCEIVWNTGLLSDMGVIFSEPARLFCDNRAALHIAAILCFMSVLSTLT